MNLELIVQIVLFVLLIIAAYTDITAGKVYNRYTFPALFSGLILNYWIGGWDNGKTNLEASMTGMAFGGGIFILFYYYGVMGGGDLKLVTAIGALKGFPFILWAIFYTSLVGAVFALLHMIWRGQLLKGLRESVTMAFRFKRKEMTEEELKGTEAARERIPYGVAISIGTMWAFFNANLRY